VTRSCSSVPSGLVWIGSDICWCRSLLRRFCSWLTYNRTIDKVRKRRLSTSICPKCGSKKRQVRNGRNPSGSLRVRCKLCGRHYTFKRKQDGYSEQRKANVLFMLKYETESESLRNLAKRAGINHETLRNWIRQFILENPQFYPLFSRRFGQRLNSLLQTTSTK